MKNYLWNMFAAIKNGQLVNKVFVRHENKKICKEFLNILWNEGFISGYKILEVNKLKIFLKYKNQRPVINSIKSISKPSRRIYYSARQLWKINPRNNVVILSTNEGLMTLVNCRKRKIGGEVFISIN